MQLFNFWNCTKKTAMFV